ncbi:unnamed protein product [Cochlearia groenlandica]
MDSDSNSDQVFTLITDSDIAFKVVPLITQAISLANSMDTTESKLSYLITRMVYVVKAADPESEFKQVINQLNSLGDPTVSDTLPKLKLLLTQSFQFFLSTTLYGEFGNLVSELIHYIRTKNTLPESESKSELMSLCTQICSYYFSLQSSELELGMEHLVSICPQRVVKFEKGECIDLGEVSREQQNKECNLIRWTHYGFNHFQCDDCYGESHEGYEKAPLEVKHTFHPKHLLHLVLQRNNPTVRGCYCCGCILNDAFYACAACNFAMSITCLEKPQVLSLNRPKWHEHRLALFPRQAFLTCNVCSLSHSSYAFYMCPRCNFVAHSQCLRLPRVIKISRHPHRISFTPSFDRGDLFCRICRKKIDKDCGGFSCIKDGCSFEAHSFCATQGTVWDCIDLEGVQEELEEVLEPYMTISDGVIQHFSHPHHQLRFYKNTSGDCDDDKVCEACFTPIFCSEMYSCMNCDFVLHEKCANLPRKLDHPTHRHQLSLRMPVDLSSQRFCVVCPRICNAFFYTCINHECSFNMHVECATISEPLVHKSHKHPLFLTSRPEDKRVCKVCKELKVSQSRETFNCIECEFVLCFYCATLPHKVGYKHDKHMLTLSYEEVTSTAIYWCEICEKEIDLMSQRFYTCEEDCCVTIHVECLVNNEFYTKPVTITLDGVGNMDIVRNSHMSRPNCMVCNKRCRHRVFYEFLGTTIVCSRFCLETLFGLKRELGER